MFQVVLIILSRIRGCVTNNNGFWIWWSDLLDALITITVNYNISHIERLLNDVSLANALPIISHWCLTLGLVSTLLEFESESYVTTDGESASVSSYKAPIWGLRPDFYYCQTAAGLLMSGALSDERTGLSFKIAAGPRQISYFWVRVPSFNSLNALPFITATRP
jgi:hypothetical protein